MTEPKTETPGKKSGEFDPVKQSKEDTQSPEQKHEAYLKRLEVLHNEP